MKIKNTDGEVVKLTKTTLSLINECHDELVLLSDLKKVLNSEDALVPAYKRPHNEFCIFHGRRRKHGFVVGGGSYAVYVLSRQIGCCTFDEKTWAKIVKAARATRKTKRKSKKKTK